MIVFEQLTKVYGAFAAVKPLSLTVQRGELFGFLGPNGAGKTTTIRMLMGILAPSSGRVLVDGFDCHLQATDVKRRVVYLPDNPIFYDSPIRKATVYVMLEPSFMSQFCALAVLIGLVLRVPALPYKLVVNRVETSDAGVLIIATASDVTLAGGA